MRLLRKISLSGLLAALALLACRASSSRDAPAAGLPRYTVRAEVVKVPAAPGGELVVRHEAIPSFADRTGAVVGMDAMVMPFPVTSDVSLAGVAPGDKVSLTFSVDWGKGRYAVERLERLPRETALTFGKPHLPGSAEPQAPNAGQAR